MGHSAGLAVRRKPGTCLRPARATALVALAVLILAACEPEPEKKPVEPAPPEPDRAVLNAVSFGDLPGWETDNHAEALPALARSCSRIASMPAERSLGRALPGALAGDIAPACAALAGIPAGDSDAARRFFETWFRPFGVAGNEDPEGLFTGYFEIELNGSLTRSETYAEPVYRRPDDLVTVDLGDFDPSLAGRAVIGRVEGGRLKPYFPRGDIQDGALDGRSLELVWLDDPLDAFMLHVQGSGRVVLDDGRATRIGYAGNNGHPYKSIGRALIDRGELQPGQASWRDIRAWIEANPVKAADLLAVNRRYIFFREITGDGPLGAQGVALTPRRSLAVDPRYIPLGLPMWLDTTWPGEDGRPMRRLVVAQDTGAAIKGPVRGDFYWGTGDAALAFAGRMKSRGRYYLLLPVPLAERMTAS